MVGPILLLLLTIHGYSQMVSFPERTSTLKAALSNIEKQTGIGNTFKGGNDRLDSLVHSLPKRPTPLLTVLHSILDPLALAFSINSNLQMILIHPDSSLSIRPIKAPVQLLTITGSVVDESKNFLAEASIGLKGGSRKGAKSDVQGHFQLKDIPEGAVLVISYNGMQAAERKVTGSGPLLIQLKPTVLPAFVLELTNGYQHISKQNATAASDVIDQKQIERRIVTDVWGLIENAGPGILMPRGGQTGNGTSITDRIQIRGRSTFLASSDPLIVVNNFQYDGDLNNINPNEIESITILKDAAAASIWGAKAGNGVIVIVLKKARSGPPQLVYHSAVGIQARPDLSNIHSIGSGDFLDFEQQLYKAGYYSFLSDPQNYMPVPPGVLILDDENKGLLSSTAADAQRAALRKLNVYNDISKYLYRTSVNQQHSLQLSAGSDSSRYYFSADYDNNVPSLTGTQYDRLNLRSQNSWQVTRKLQIEAGINFSETNNRNGGNIQYAYQSPVLNNRIYPYAQLVDAQGHALPLYLDYNANYLQQTQAASFPNWEFRPQSELAAEVNKVRNRDYLLTSAIRYTILKPLILEARYQFEDQSITGRDLHSDSSYFTRDLRNSVIQVDPITHNLSYPVPAGDILDVNSREVVSHQGRLQLNFTREWKKIHELQAIAGYEIRSVETTGNTDRYYGYDPGRSAVNPNIDYTRTYAQYLTYTPHNIPNPQAVIQLADHFISYYGNASYSYRHRYHLYGSIRFDQANLFGVATNEKGVPLWSGGLSWQADQEDWYPLREWLPFLKVRGTYGYSGNIARLASAYTTAMSFPGGISGSPYTMLVIQSPPNKQLRWERVGQLNFGIDFATRHNILSGTMEYYQKHARDLLAQTSADPTLGLAQSPGTAGSYYGNTGGLNGHGIDLQLEAHIISGPFSWTTNWFLSYSASRVTQYLNPVGLGNLYHDQTAINPVMGKPLYSVYSFKASTLDPKTGAFQGIYQEHTSSEYNLIYNNTLLKDMNFSGPALPVYFGSMRNSFSMGALSLSFLFSFQAGHYYRQPATSQSDLAVHWQGFSDYARRWQQVGDEKRTNVPAFHYPIDGQQDLIYSYSSSLVKKSDEIRWDELTISYDLDKQKQKRLPFEHLRLYGTIMGMGLLWAANKDHTDPYYIDVPKDRPRYSLGITIHLLPFTPAK